MSPRGPVAILVFASIGCNSLSGAAELSIVDPPPRVDESVVDAAASPSPPPTCACVAAPASDWNGPMALLEALGGAPRPCPTGLASTKRLGSDPTGANECTPCGCEPPSGECTTRVTQTRNSCSLSCGAATSITTACSKMDYCAPKSYFTAAGTQSATCVPSGGAVVPPSWARTATVCSFEGSPSGSCSAGEVCAPKSDGAGDARTCIVRDGDLPCPSGPYTARIVYDSRMEDSRSCSVCTCDPAGLSCSPANIAFFNTTDCTNPIQTKDVGSSCTDVDFTDAQGSWKLTSPSTVQGQCAAAGGKPSGTIVGIDPVTVCCLP